MGTRQDPERFAEVSDFCFAAVSPQGAVGIDATGRLVLLLPQMSQEQLAQLTETLAGRWKMDVEVSSLPWVDATALAYAKNELGAGIGLGLEATPDSATAEPGSRAWLGLLGPSRRTRDMILAAAALILLSPLLLLLALTIKITSPGPVFSVDDRMGRGGRQCRVYRFRARVHETTTTLRYSPDPRMLQLDRPATDGMSLTSVGSFLNQTRLDRLPQLWNVLRGDLPLS